MANKVARRMLDSLFMALEFDEDFRIGPKRTVQVDDVAVGIFYFDVVQFERQVVGSAIGKHYRFHFGAIIGAHFCVVNESFHGIGV